MNICHYFAHTPKRFLYVPLALAPAFRFLSVVTVYF